MTRALKAAVTLFFAVSLFFIFPRAAVALEHRGLFVASLQQPTTLSDRVSIERVVTFANDHGVDTLFVQIYRANRAWFPSQVGDSSPYAACLKNVGEDPLALLIRRAHASGIQVHAWVNLLSLGENNDAPLLRKYGSGILTRNLKKKNSLSDYKIDGQYFLEPSDARVRRELSRLVEEIVRTYPDLDGLQFDYIRYPDWHPFYGYTPENLRRFHDSTGEARADESVKAWKDWRRGQVTDLLRFLALKARSLRPGIQISTTGLVPYTRAFHEAFQDWKLWARAGYVDFVTLMNYASAVPEFEKNVSDARKRGLKAENTNIAVGAYRFTDDPETFLRQWDACEKASPRACVAFHYDSLIENPGLSAALKSENSGGFLRLGANAKESP